MSEPFDEARTRHIARAEMPLAHESAAITNGREHVRDQRLAIQIIDPARRHAAGTNPVVDAVLRWNVARHERCACGRTDGRCAKEILEPHATLRQLVQYRRPDLGVTRAAEGPRTLV